MSLADSNAIAPELSGEFARGEQAFVAISLSMRALETAMRNVAASQLPVLILGEPGTGKRGFAFRIHQLSPHSHETFSELECDELSPACLPLHRGNSNKRALFPDSGTVVLHEVSSLTAECQLQLLELLVYRFQSDEVVNVAPRMIFTSHSNLEQEIRLGRFREDLYYWMSGFCLRVPPLRHRKEDIAPLAEVFLSKYAGRLQCAKPTLSEATLRFFLDYAWPGNVRELEEATRTITAIGDERLALAALKSVHRGARRQSARVVALSLKEASKAASRAVEKDLILEVLSRTRWNRKRAAGELKISYKALLYKLKDMGVRNPNACSPGEA